MAQSFLWRSVPMDAPGLQDEVIKARARAGSACWRSDSAGQVEMNRGAWRRAEMTRDRDADCEGDAAQTFGSVTPGCFRYLPFLSAYDRSHGSSLWKNSTCAMPSFA